MEIESSVAPDDGLLCDAFVDPSELVSVSVPSEDLGDVQGVEAASQMNTRSMRMLIDRIHGMKEEEHQQIFRLLQNETSKYTTNLNGVFVNLAHLEQKTLHKLLNLVDYFEKQAQRMDESEQMLRHIRETHDTSGGAQTGDSVPEEVSAYLGTLNL